MAERWQGQTVVIVGAARQGLALARYLLRHGARVILTDQRAADALSEARQSLADLENAGLPLEWVLGAHPMSLLDSADWLCPSGGVPLTLPLVQEAQRRGIQLTNDSQVFLEAAPCRVIGITGSAGKTTTTTLVGRMAAAASQAAQPDSALYRRSYVGGNIGSPLIAEVDEMQPDDLAIMELSSFQLEIMTRSPQVGAILNITPNHLDRHGTMEAYAAAKAHILSHQTPAGRAVLGRDDPGAWAQRTQVVGEMFSFGFSRLPEGQAGGYLQGHPSDPQSAVVLHMAPGGEAQTIVHRAEIRLRGDHNVLNTLAACTIASAAGLPLEAMRAGIQGFTGVAHRMELVRTWGGAEWYNVSISTAPERVMADIHAFSEPLVLLVGGRDKKLPWDVLMALVQQRVKHLVVFGEAAEIVLQALERSRPGGEVRLQSVTRCAGLRQAVQAAAHVVEPGDVVLLSPGGTSFDEFKDFEERGLCFAQWVNDLE